MTIAAVLLKSTACVLGLWTLGLALLLAWMVTLAFSGRDPWVDGK